ncbi:hypothetical protein C0J52_04312 [Blattella germanica]|nr:hypothetical protein C0J52_04312 [Blattella germanica]
MEHPLASSTRCELLSVIRFLCAKNTAQVDIHSQLCEVFGDNCLSIQHVRQWCRDFKDRRTDIYDEQHSRRPSILDETFAKVEEAVLKDQRVAVRELTKMIPDISKTSIDKSLVHHLGYSKVCARWVPRQLKTDHKQQRIEAAHEFCMPTIMMARNSWTPLLLGTRSGFTIHHRK